MVSIFSIKIFFLFGCLYIVLKLDVLPQGSHLHFLNPWALCNNYHTNFPWRTNLSTQIWFKAGVSRSSIIISKGNNSISLYIQLLPGLRSWDFDLLDFDFPNFDIRILLTWFTSWILTSQILNSFILTSYILNSRIWNTKGRLGKKGLGDYRGEPRETQGNTEGGLGNTKGSQGRPREYQEEAWGYTKGGLGNTEGRIGRPRECQGEPRVTWGNIQEAKGIPWEPRGWCQFWVNDHIGVYGSLLVKTCGTASPPV